MATRALVLSGGGPVGIAWESGILAGLAEAGVTLADADLIVGTSAGSVVGAQLALGRSPQDLVAAQLTRSEAARTADASTAAAPDLTPLIEMMSKAAAGGRSADAVRAEIGAFALQAPTVSEEEFIAGFGRWAQDGETAWPDGFVCTAVDAQDGTFTIWDKSSGVSLPRAVASSCAVPGIYPPITINGRRYMDGGMRSGTNADLARGHDVVVIITLTDGTSAAGPTPLAEQMRRRFEEEAAALRDSGSAIEVIGPDAASLEAFGLNLMDFSRRAGAAEAGLRQGKAEAERLRTVWR